jgi:hypothetical protein
MVFLCRLAQNKGAYELCNVPLIGLPGLCIHPTKPHCTASKGQKLLNDIFPVNYWYPLVFLKVKSSVEQISNLKDHIQDLENDLQMSQLVQKRMERKVHHFKREKLAYKKFVSELMCALSQKGIARVIDGQGSEVSYSFYKGMFSYLHQMSQLSG